MLAHGGSALENTSRFVLCAAALLPATSNCRMLIVSESLHRCFLKWLFISISVLAVYFVPSPLFIASFSIFVHFTFFFLFTLSFTLFLPFLIAHLTACPSRMLWTLGTSLLLRSNSSSNDLIGRKYADVPKICRKLIFKSLGGKW